MRDVPEGVGGVLDSGEPRGNDSAAIKLVNIQVDGVDDQTTTQTALTQVAGNQLRIL